MDGGLELAFHVAERLDRVDGVLAVVLGGSLARGVAKANSDIDLGIYYRSDRPPELKVLRELAAAIDDSGAGDAVTDFGGWGPWIDGGAWLRVQGRPLDWIYRDLDKVEGVLGRSLQGHVERHAQPGHPHGFHAHIYLGEVFYCRALYDPNGVVERLKGRLEPYPPKLRQALIDTYLWQAEFALSVSEKAAARGESPYVAGCFFECAYCLVQVLYALNGRYYVNEKGAVGETATFALRPARFAETVYEVLAAPGATSEALHGSLAKLRALVGEVEGLSR